MKHSSYESDNHDGNNKVGVAIFFIVLGIILLLRNLDILPFDIPSYFYSWEMILIVIGTFYLLRGKIFPGIPLIAIGSYFLAPEIFDVSIKEVQRYWPVLLILIGIAVLIKRKRRNGNFKRYKNEVSAGFVSNSVVFGGISRKITNKNFDGAKLIAVFGGLELDLTECILTEKENKIVIEATAVFGGISLTVPKEWNIKNEIVPVMGGFEDSGQKQNFIVNSTNEIIMTGNAVFGGIKIKRV